MIVDTPVEKLYSIKAEDGKVVKFPQSLVDQCEVLKGIIGGLGELIEGEPIDVPQPSQSLQLLVQFHDAVIQDVKTDLREVNAFGTTQDAQNELLKARSIPVLVKLSEVARYLAYFHEARLMDKVLDKLTCPGYIGTILNSQASKDLARSFADERFSGY